MVHNISISRDEINDILGNGIPEGSLFTIVGDSSTGKSVWSQRISYGLCKNEDSVLYFSGEDNSRTIIDQTESLNYDFRPHMLDNQLTFMCLSGQEKEMDVEITDLFSPIEKIKSDVVVIDGFGEILSRSQTDETNNHQIRKFLRYIDSIKRSKQMSFLITINPIYLSGKSLELISSRSTIYSRISNRTVADETVSNLRLAKYKRPDGEFISDISFSVRYGEGIYQNPTDYV